MSLFASLPSEVQRLESYIDGIKAAFAGKAAVDAKTQQLEANLASTQAELAIAQDALTKAEASEADLTARLKTANDTIASLTATPAPAGIPAG